MRPLIINVNRPRVNRIAGNDKMMMIGLSILLMTENIKPANKNVNKPPSDMVPKSRNDIQMPNEFIAHLNRNTKNCRFITLLLIIIICSHFHNSLTSLTAAVAHIRTLAGDVHFLRATRCFNAKFFTVSALNIHMNRATVIIWY